MQLDIGLGIIGAIIFSVLTHTSLTAGLVVIAIIFALLPDTDGLLQIIRQRSIRRLDYRHREFLHYPLLYILIGFMICLALFSWPIAWLFAALSLAHFIHDSVGIGFGVAWPYPFSCHYYKSFSEKDGSFSTRLLVRWSPQEQAAVAERFKDYDWIKEIYLRPHPINIIETGFFILSIILLLLALH